MVCSYLSFSVSSMYRLRMAASASACQNGVFDWSPGSGDFRSCRIARAMVIRSCVRLVLVKGSLLSCM